MIFYENFYLYYQRLFLFKESDLFYIILFFFLQTDVEWRRFIIFPEALSKQSGKQKEKGAKKLQQ